MKTEFLITGKTKSTKEAMLAVRLINRPAIMIVLLCVWLMALTVALILTGEVAASFFYSLVVLFVVVTCSAFVVCMLFLTAIGEHVLVIEAAFRAANETQAAINKARYNNK
jgi:hypothetical protein